MEKYNFGEDEQYLLKQCLVAFDNFHDLEQAEQLAFTVRSLEIEQGKYTVQQFDFNSLLNLHYYLFQDVYKFAGKIRDVQLVKESTRFCQIQFISTIGNEIFSKLQEEGTWETLEEA